MVIKFCGSLVAKRLDFGFRLPKVKVFENMAYYIILNYFIGNPFRQRLNKTPVLFDLIFLNPISIKMK